MLITSTQMAAWLGDFLWPLMRVGMLFAVAPIFGGKLVPMRVRLVLTLLVTWVLVPVIPSAPLIDPLSAAGVLITIQQLLIGLLLGFMLQMVFTVLTLAGHLIATGMGLGFASMVDPQNDVNVPVIGQFYVTLATLLFLVLNGHLMMISVLADSFHTMPVAVDGISRESLWDVVAWASRMFAGGVLIALPAVTALLMTNIAFGVITRAAPQLHIFNVGFPVTLALGFIVIFISLPGLTPQLSDILGEAFEVMKGLSPAGDAHG